MGALSDAAPTCPVMASWKATGGSFPPAPRQTPATLHTGAGVPKEPAGGSVDTKGASPAATPASQSVRRSSNYYFLLLGLRGVVFTLMGNP